jgi:hypothetical protein
MPQCKGTTQKGTRCLRNSSPKKATKKRGCKSQSQKKYTKRRSPPYPANECCNKVMIGNDGNKYKSVANVNGVCRWIKVKS